MRASRPTKQGPIMAKYTDLLTQAALVQAVRDGKRVEFFDDEFGDGYWEQSTYSGMEEAGLEDAIRTGMIEGDMRSLKYRAVE